MQRWAFQSFGVHFVEVAIDPLMPRVQVRRFVSMCDVGRIVNPKTARSQGMGGVVMGIGMALGVAAAIANAVFQATDIRIRELPILPHKVIA